MASTQSNFAFNIPPVPFFTPSYTFHTPDKFAIGFTSEWLDIVPDMALDDKDASLTSKLMDIVNPVNDYPLDLSNSSGMNVMIQAINVDDISLTEPSMLKLPTRSKKRGREHLDRTSLQYDGHTIDNEIKVSTKRRKEKSNEEALQLHIVSTSGSLLTLEFDAQCLVLQVKSELEILYGYQSCDHHLLFGSKMLSDMKSLKEQNVFDGAKLYLVCKLLGG